MHDSINIVSFRSETTEEELGEMTKTNNPEEIDIDEDETDEDEQVEGLNNSLCVFVQNEIDVVNCGLSPLKFS